MGLILERQAKKGPLESGPSFMRSQRILKSHSRHGI